MTKKLNVLPKVLWSWSSLPCHNQNVERHVKLVTEACTSVFTFPKRDDVITWFGKKFIKIFENKGQFRVGINIPWTCFFYNSVSLVFAADLWLFLLILTCSVLVLFQRFRTEVSFRFFFLEKKNYKIVSLQGQIVLLQISQIFKFQDFRCLKGVS